MTRDPNYDTWEEYEMDREPDPRKTKALQDDKLHRCQCSMVAKIRTVYDRQQVIYHCSDICRDAWMKGSPRPVVIHKTERAAGWPLEAPAK